MYARLPGAGIVQKRGNLVRWHPRLFPKQRATADAAAPEAAQLVGSPHASSPVGSSVVEKPADGAEGNAAIASPSAIAKADAVEGDKDVKGACK